LVDLPRVPPSLYIDIEGINLCRDGEISILQIFVSTKKMTYLVDIHTLKKIAFSTPGTDGKTTLKTILESSAIPKVFFDVRNDSDALYSLFGVELQGIQDVQLMELATRAFSKRYVNGLARCISNDASLTFKESREWTDIKNKGRSLFAPEMGGSYHVFNVRPLAEELRSYCVQDVQFLPRLRAHYYASMSQMWKDRVEVATRARVAESQSTNYRPHGRQKALGPW
jgi:exonuclease 3'-5' domain-containing protein 1